MPRGCVLQVSRWQNTKIRVVLAHAAFENVDDGHRVAHRLGGMPAVGKVIFTSSPADSIIETGPSVPVEY